MATIIAIGGEEVGVLSKDNTNKRVVTKDIHKEILAQASTPRPKVLYIPTAKDDREDFIAGFTTFYKDLGANEVRALRLIGEKPSLANVKEKIAWADVIYVNGGNTFRMLRIWERYGVADLLRKAWQNGTILAGHSAGAVCWFAYACSDSFYKKQPFKLTGLGFVNALLCPHYDTEPVRQTALKEMMRCTSGLVALTLDEYAAIEIIDGTYRILSADPGAKARKAYWQNGSYVQQNLPITISFSDLGGLLTKQA